MKKLFTQIVTLLMAITMCLPNSITTLAAEVDTTTEATAFMATISQADHGTIAFTGYTESNREFKKDDTVDVTLKLDIGYKVSQFKVTSTDTGKVLAQKDTSDNRFAFAMLEKNITVTAVFDTAEKAIELPDDNNSDDAEEKSDDGDRRESLEVFLFLLFRMEILEVFLFLLFGTDFRLKFILKSLKTKANSIIITLKIGIKIKQECSKHEYKSGKEMPENEKQTDVSKNSFETKYGELAWQDGETDTKETPPADCEIRR